MLNFFVNYGLFLLKAITIILAILALFGGLIAIAGKNKTKLKEKITIRNLNEKFADMRQALNFETLGKADYKAFLKSEKEKEKAKAKREKELEKKNKKAVEKNAKKTESQKRIFVLNFNGDVKAEAVEALREEVTAVLTVATLKDEVLVKIESPGGVMHGYGLASSQLARIRERKIPLIAAVDKVAASGGYMMASVADKILAAPFAIVGSIGVVAELPNFNRLLKKHDIAYEQITAGEYKRTLSLFGENTEKGRKKMQNDVEEAHRIFKKFVEKNRPKVTINQVSTGEIWYGAKALQLKLVDELVTSDDYLLKASEKENVKIYEITYTCRKNLAERLAHLNQKLQKILTGPSLF